MPRYAALLRAVSPTNAKMPDLKRAFEAAGFEDVRTVLATGNVVFGAPEASEATLEGAIEEALPVHLGRGFLTIVRRVEDLRALLLTDPYAPFDVSPDAKRVVTFLRHAPAGPLALPVERDGARILCVHGREVFSAYDERVPNSPVMTLVEKTFGTEVTTRTWLTVTKVAR